MIAIVVYELDFDVYSDCDSAMIDAETSIEAVYLFEDKEQAMEFRQELSNKHPNMRWSLKDAIEPLREKLEREKYEKRMRGDWS